VSHVCVQIAFADYPSGINLVVEFGILEFAHLKVSGSQVDGEIDISQFLNRISSLKKFAFADLITIA
jgi:hypothetical protein